MTGIMNSASTMPINSLKRFDVPREYSEKKDVTNTRKATLERGLTYTKIVPRII
jgi:hypothetical protein